jgi:hypothetical protein
LASGECAGNGILGPLAHIQASLPASKLVGAGMDRIAHAWYVNNVRPIELAARSKSAILLVPENDPLATVNLLGM